MKALMFAPAFAPHMGSESLVTSKLVLALRGAGWEVDVISRRETDLYSNTWEPPWAELEARTYQISAPRLAAGRELLARLRDAWKLGHPVAGIRWAAAAIELAQSMLSRNTYDVLLSRSPPDIGHLPALVLSKQSQLPWIANWNDPPLGAWPEPYGAENGSSIQRLLFQRMVRKVYQAAALNTFPSAELSSHVERHFGLCQVRNSIVIPHATLPVEPTSERQSRQFVLTHAGKLVGARNPASFLEGMRRFIVECTPSPQEFVLSQIGHADRDLNDVAERHQVGAYVTSMGPMSFVATMQMLSQSTVNVMVEAPCAEGVFLPGKLTDYAQAGRPILAVSPKRGVAARLLMERGGGLHADVESPGDIHSALRRMYREWQDRTLNDRYRTDALLVPFSAKTIGTVYEYAVSVAKLKRRE